MCEHVITSSGAVLLCEHVITLRVYVCVCVCVCFAHRQVQPYRFLSNALLLIDW